MVNIKNCFFVFILMLFYSCWPPLLPVEQQTQMTIIHTHEPKLKIDFIFQQTPLSPNVFFINFYQDDKKIKEFKYIDAYKCIISSNRVDSNTYTIVLGSDASNDFCCTDTFTLNASKQEVVKISNYESPKNYDNN